MSGRFEDPPGPFTIKQRGDHWEVAVIIEGYYKEDVECENEDDARALASLALFRTQVSLPRLVHR